MFNAEGKHTVFVLVVEHFGLFEIKWINRLYSNNDKLKGELDLLFNGKIVDFFK